MCFMLIKSSTTYNELLNRMGRQLTFIAAGVENLPTNVVKVLPASHLSGSSTSKPRIELLPQLDRGKYRNLRYWQRAVYLRQKKSKGKNKGKGKARDDEDDADATDLDDAESETSGQDSGSKADDSATSCYMEDENGNQVPESDRDTARAKAKAFWVKLFKSGMAPASFSRLDIDAKDEYILLMETAFPWLRYCENHWKCEQIWLNHYPPWYRGEVRRAKKAAEEKAAKEAAKNATKAAVEKAAAEGKIIEVDADNGNVQDDQERLPKRP